MRALHTPCSRVPPPPPPPELPAGSKLRRSTLNASSLSARAHTPDDDGLKWKAQRGDFDVLRGRWATLFRSKSSSLWPLLWHPDAHAPLAPGAHLGASLAGTPASGLTPPGAPHGFAAQSITLLPSLPSASSLPPRNPSPPHCACALQHAAPDAPLEECQGVLTLSGRARALRALGE